jgi:hypothetical protein
VAPKTTLNSRTWLGLFGKFILAVNLSRKVCQEYFETLNPRFLEFTFKKI